MTPPTEAALDTAAPRRRRDARRNRDIFLEKAQAAFAVEGVDASLEQIARDAGLAIGTLYRHFPTRMDLLVAALEPRLARFLETAEQALAYEDAWEGFCYYLEALFAAQAGDRGFNDFISMRFPADPRTEALCDRMCDLIARVVERAQASAQLRPDIGVSDIISLIWANGRIVEATSHAAPQAWRRHVHLMIDAYRANRAHDLPEPPLSDDQLYQAMTHLSGAKRGSPKRAQTRLNDPVSIRLWVMQLSHRRSTAARPIAGSLFTRHSFLAIGHIRLGGHLRIARPGLH